MKRTGHLIDKVRAKELDGNKLRHQNPFLFKAESLRDYLFTEVELKTSQVLSKAKIGEGRPLFIEVGCYLGKNLKEFCEYNKDNQFIGLDITYKRVVTSAQKLEKENLHNGKVIMIEAQFFFTEFVEDNTLSGVMIFFPDPWEKIRDEKKRLLSLSFLNTLRSKLVPGGFIWFKSDHKGYFDQVLKLSEEAQFLPSFNEVPKELNPASSYTTQFELLFNSKHVPHYSVVLR